MSSIIIASVPGHGHVMPLLAVARGYVERGDRVRFITGGRFAEVVAATGAAHVPLPKDADYDDREDLNVRSPERADLKGIRAIAFDIEHTFIRPSRPQYEALMAAHAAHAADAVLADVAFLGAAFLLGHPRAERPAVVVCGVVPLPITSHDTAPFGLGLPPARWLNRPRNAVLTAATRPLLARPNRIADKMYREVHGTGLPFSLFNWPAAADAIVQFTVPGFEYPRSDAPSVLQFVGPLTAPGSRAPLPDWWADLDGTHPVVHVAQGTLANKDYAQAIAPTLEALADQDVLVVVSTGGRALETLPALPANARAALYLPYDQLLPRTSVFVTNGGYGGVQYALRYGVPIVATGGKEDKPEVGARVVWSGVGRRLRTERPTARALRRAILDVLSDSRYREASQRLAADVAASPGFDGLANTVDGLIAHRT